MEVPRYAVGKIAHRARIRYMQSWIALTGTRWVLRGGSPHPPRMREIAVFAAVSGTASAKPRPCARSRTANAD